VHYEVSYSYQHPTDTNLKCPHLFLSPCSVVLSFASFPMLYYSYRDIEILLFSLFSWLCCCVKAKPPPPSHRTSHPLIENANKMTFEMMNIDGWQRTRRALSSIMCVYFIKKTRRNIKKRENTLCLADVGDAVAVALLLCLGGCCSALPAKHTSVCVLPQHGKKEFMDFRTDDGETHNGNIYPLSGLEK
jgi:hypothetical protein